MHNRLELDTYGRQVEQELLTNILPFYEQFCVDEEWGGFYGRVDNDGTIHPDASKGLVQHSRLLWTYAHAFRTFAHPIYRHLAEHALDFLLAHFWDDEFGGFFWLVDAQGRSLARRKMIYGQAFAVYGFSEYSLATGDKKSLDTAVSLYHLLEARARDPIHQGYFDAFNQAWVATPEINVDLASGPVTKTMNTHLHLLEAYTNLYRAWPDKQLQQSLQQLIRLHLVHIVNEQSGHLSLHFDTGWQTVNDLVSHGHDIEASWLLVEAAQALGETALLSAVTPVALRLAEVTLAKGVKADGGILYENPPGSRVWWVQAEGMVGFLNAYQLTGEHRYLEASANCWAFARDYLVDRHYGEWLYGLTADKRPLPEEKAGEWKTPYHNGRACLEIMRRSGQTNEPTHYPDQIA